MVYMLAGTIILGSDSVYKEKIVFSMPSPLTALKVMILLRSQGYRTQPFPY